MDNASQHWVLTAVDDCRVNVPHRVDIGDQAHRAQWISARQRTRGIQAYCFITEAVDVGQIENSQWANRHLDLISQRKKILVKTCVASQFRVKRCGEEMSLLCGDNPSVRDGGENLRITMHRLDDRCPDE